MAAYDLLDEIEGPAVEVLRAVRSANATIRRQSAVQAGESDLYRAGQVKQILLDLAEASLTLARRSELEIACARSSRYRTVLTPDGLRSILPELRTPVPMFEAQP